MATGPEVAGPINLGNPHEITVGELATLTIKLANSDTELVTFPLPADDPRRRCPDITVAQEQLGWRPTVDLETGLTRTIAWFADSLEGLS